MHQTGGVEAEDEILRPRRYKASSIDSGTSPRSNYGPSTPLGLLPQNKRPVAPIPVTPSFENHRSSRKSSGSNPPLPFATPSAIDPSINSPGSHAKNLSEIRAGPTLTSSNSKYRLSEDLDLVDLLKQMETIYDDTDAEDFDEDGRGTGDSTRQFETSFSESSLSSLAAGQASDESIPVYNRMSPVEEVPKFVAAGQRRSGEESLL